MELYLRWLAKHERLPGEQAPLGLILCAAKTEEHVQLLEVNRSGIRVARYLTELPSQAVARTLASLGTGRERAANCA